MKRRLKGPKPKAPASFQLIPGVTTEGKPYVRVDFGKFGGLNLVADDVERFKAALDTELQKAAALRRHHGEL